MKIGIIIKTLKAMQPRFNKILESAKQVDTRELHRVQEQFIFDSFALLKPLSYKYQKVCDLTESDGKTSGKALFIGTWLRTKWTGYGYMKYGSIASYPHSANNHFKKHGLEICKLCRGPIKEDFKALCGLLDKLKDYKSLFTIENFDRKELTEYELTGYSNKLTLKPLVVNRIGVHTDRPHRILISDQRKNLYVEREVYKGLSEKPNLAIWEDLLDELEALFTKTRITVDKVKIHNERITKKMADVTIAWKIAGKLKNTGRY